MYIFTVFLWVNKGFQCLKQLPINFTLVLKSIYFNEGARLLLDVEGCLILSSDNPLDFHDEIWSVYDQ